MTLCELEIMKQKFMALFYEYMNIILSETWQTVLLTGICLSFLNGDVSLKLALQKSEQVTHSEKFRFFASNDIFHIPPIQVFLQGGVGNTVISQLEIFSGKNFITSKFRHPQLRVTSPERAKKQSLHPLWDRLEIKLCDNEVKFSRETHQTLHWEVLPQ